MEVVTKDPISKTIADAYKNGEEDSIPNDWEIRLLRKLVNFTNGKAHEKSIDESGDYIVVNSKFISTEGEVKKFTNENNCPAKQNNILMVMSDVPNGKAIAKCYLVEEDNLYTVNQRICALQAIDVDSKFLFYALDRNKYYLQFDDGVKQTNLRKDDVLNCPLPLPPTLEEQRAIAEALSDVDALIAELNALIEKKQQIKKGAMQQLLSGKKRLPGFDGEWEEKRLGDVARVQRGASPRPISSPKWFSLEKDVGWVRISDISDSDGKNLLKTKDYLSKAGIERSRFLPKGSLILSIAATVGLPVITRIDTCIHDGFVGLTNLEVDQEFLYYKLKELENDLVEMGQTGSQNNINSTIVRNVEAFFPPREEQKAIARTLSDMDAELQALQSKRAKYQQIKQGMMQELLTGKTRLV